MPQTDPVRHALGPKSSKTEGFFIVLLGVRKFDPDCPQPWTPPQETFIKVSKTEGTKTVRLVAQDCLGFDTPWAEGPPIFFQ